MALSSSSLFHFTKGGMAALQGILLEGFWVTYNNEVHPKEFFENSHSFGMPNFSPNLTTFRGKLGNRQYSTSIKIPMTCFCDIPLSGIEKHSEKYGKYAIGLTKTWGIKNGLNPVFYVARNSLVARSLSSFQMETSREPNNTHNIPCASGAVTQVKLFNHDAGNTEIIDDFGYVYPVHLLYIKPISETIINPGGTNNFNYQDEKEWRYIPDYPYLHRFDETHFQTLDLMNYWNFLNRHQVTSKKREIKYPNLTFELTDITFIMVEKESEISSMADFLLNKFTDDQSSAISRLISFERIKEDVLNY